MASAAHLWAIGYDDVRRAEQARAEILRLASGAGAGGKYLILLDTAIVARHCDGTYSIDHQHFAGTANIAGCTMAGFLAGLVLAAPLTGATLGAVVGGLGTVLSASSVGISDDFVREIESLMSPGTCALFVLDEQGDLDVILHSIQGLGGKVLRSNVDSQRAKLIQSALAADLPNSKSLGES